MKFKKDRGVKRTTMQMFEEFKEFMESIYKLLNKLREVRNEVTETPKPHKQIAKGNNI